MLRVCPDMTDKLLTGALNNYTKVQNVNTLTQISLASFSWDIGKLSRMQHLIWGYSVCLKEFNRKMK